MAWWGRQRYPYAYYIFEQVLFQSPSQITSFLIITNPIRTLFPNPRPRYENGGFHVVWRICFANITSIYKPHLTSTPLPTEGFPAFRVEPRFCPCM